MHLRLPTLGALILLVLPLGCGTTRISDTARTATEQMLVSNSIDEAISQMNFKSLSGKTVYLDAQYLDGIVDKGYLVSSIRQHLLASGCLLQEDKTKAAYVVEARAGAVGTDRHDLLFGIPQFNIPATLPGYPTGLIPEIPFAKKTDKKAVAKVAVFAYNRNTGRPVFQSGVAQASSTAKDIWVLGAGPFQRGTIHEGMEFAGEPIQIPLFAGKNDEDEEAPTANVPVTRMATWAEPPEVKETPKSGEKAVTQTSTDAKSGLTPPPNPLDRQTKAKETKDANPPKPLAVPPNPAPINGK